MRTINSKLKQSIETFYELKRESPNRGLSILSLENTQEETLVISKPYRWLADEYYYNHRFLNHRIKSDIKIPRPIIRKFEVAKTEQDYKDLMIETMQAVSQVWVLHLYVGSNTDINGFCRLFLFACDVLPYTLPVVHMTKAFWEDFKFNGLPETVTRLKSNIIINPESFEQREVS